MTYRKKAIETRAILAGLAALMWFAGPAGAAGIDGEDWAFSRIMVAAADQDNMTDSDQQWASNGAQTCLKCHDDPEVTGILHRAHGQTGDSRTPFAARQCETCHGASPQHMEKPAPGEKRKPPTIVFGMDSPTPVDEQNNVCLGCHENRARMHWRGSTHQFGGLSCATCHDPHKPQPQMATSEGQQKVCFTCHTDIRTEVFKRSHHPIREGLLSCSDCHAPHGSFTRALLKEPTVNQTCYQCHEEKRGPFLWEHEPVREDCTICHTPHGSSQVTLLRTRGPWLCQQCHATEFHPSSVYDGNAVEELDIHTIANQCLNCHSKIHGSNDPSGTRFVR